jgi:hypothetical protein
MNTGTKMKSRKFCATATHSILKKLNEKWTVALINK